MERAEEEEGSCLGLRDELKYPQGPFSSVTESCIMNFSSVPFYDVQENRRGFDTVMEPKMPRRSPTRGPKQQTRTVGRAGAGSVGVQRRNSERCSFR